MQIVCEENGKSTACTMVFHFFALRIELVAAVAVTATIVKLFDPTYIIMSANVTDSEETDPAETDPAPTANRELDSASYEHLVALKKKKTLTVIIPAWGQNESLALVVTRMMQPWIA